MKLYELFNQENWNRVFTANDGKIYKVVEGKLYDYCEEGGWTKCYSILNCIINKEGTIEQSKEEKFKETAQVILEFKDKYKPSSMTMNVQTRYTSLRQFKDNTYYDYSDLLIEINDGTGECMDILLSYEDIEEIYVFAQEVKYLLGSDNNDK